MPVGQKRAPGLIKDGCKPLGGYWESYSGSLAEQPVLLTSSEPSLQNPPSTLNPVGLSSAQIQGMCHHTSNGLTNLIKEY